MHTQDPRAYKISDFFNETELHRLPGLYEQFLQPLGLEDQFVIVLTVSQSAAIQGRLKQAQPKLIGINLYRSDRSFSERDRAVLNLLHPHLLQAYQNAAALTQNQQELDGTQTDDRATRIGLCEQGQVRWITDRAWSLLRQYDLTGILPQKGHLSESLERWIKHQIALRTQPQEVPEP